MKKNLKLIMLLILLFIMSLSLFGCGGAKKKPSSDNGTGQQTGQEKPAEDKEKKPENEEELKPQKKMTDEEIEKIFEMKKESDGLSIKKYIDISETLKNITVPGEYKGSKIKKIEDDAFFNQTIESVDISGDVEEIGYRAFYRCKNLKKITLREGVKKIGKNAFYNTPIETLNIPSSVETIGDMAFNNCRSLKKLTLNEGLKQIGREAFEDAPLEDLKTPSTVEKISDLAFASCESLKMVTLNEGLKEIGDSAFRDTKINTITIPSTVTLIRKYAFLRSSITTINCKVTKSYVESNEVNFAGLLEKKDKINWVNG